MGESLHDRDRERTRNSCQRENVSEKKMKERLTRAAM